MLCLSIHPSEFISHAEIDDYYVISDFLAFFFSTVTLDRNAEQDRRVCGDTNFAQRSNSLLEKTSLTLQCDVDTVFWNDTTVVWQRNLPTVERNLSHPIIRDADVHFPQMRISHSGDYTCIIQNDDQMVLQYTVTLNVFRK